MEQADLWQSINPVSYTHLDVYKRQPNQTFKQKEKIIMSSKNTNKLNVPEARAAMNKFKMEAASEVDVPRTY